MSYRVYIPCDTSAVAVGADKVAASLKSEAERLGLEVDIIRNGSRGMFWLEPMLEVVTPQGRVAYGPVRKTIITPSLEDRVLHAGDHPLIHGLTEDIPFLKNQERLTFARVGVTNPTSLTDYEANGGWAGLRAALAMPAETIVAAVTASGLRGRGGAAFPAGIKWQTV